jgi:uncharacterized protein (DUF1697 family)
VTRYAVLLRAVNVGGHNQVPMARLREIVAELGYSEAVTYVQSGNLVVTAKAAKPAAVEQAVRSALREELDVDVDVIVRTRAELAAVVAANPFASVADDDAKLLVSFLTAAPDAAKAKSLDRDEFLPERFELGERCVYFWLPNGAGRSKLAAAPWDRRLGVRGTGRNWRTVKKLIELLDAG